jgi:hypothetical protein
MKDLSSMMMLLSQGAYVHHLVVLSRHTKGVSLNMASEPYEHENNDSTEGVIVPGKYR